MVNIKYIASHSFSAIHPEFRTKAKQQFPCGLWKVFLFLANVIFLPKTRRIAISAFAVTWHHCHKGSHRQSSWENMMNSILALISEIKFTFGRQGFSAAHVQGLFGRRLINRAEGLIISGKNFPKYVRPRWKKELFLVDNLNN